MLTVYLFTGHYSQSLSAPNETTIRVLSLSSKSVWTPTTGARRYGRTRRGAAKTPKGVRASAVGNSSAPRGVNKGGAGTSEPAFLTPWRESQTMAIASSRTPLAHTLKLTQ